MERLPLISKEVRWTPAEPQLQVRAPSLALNARVLGAIRASGFERSDVVAKRLRQWLGADSLTAGEQAGCEELAFRLAALLDGSDSLGRDGLACVSIVQELQRPSVQCGAPSTATHLRSACAEAWGGLSDPGRSTVLADIHHGLTTIMKSIGRVEPENGGPNNYVGTAFLLAMAGSLRGIAATNLHVARVLVDGGPLPTSRALEQELRAPYFLSFDDGSPDLRRAKIVRVCSHPAPFEPGSMRLDVALLEVDFSAIDSRPPSLTPVPLSIDWRGPEAWFGSPSSSNMDTNAILVCGFPSGEVLEARALSNHWQILVRRIFGSGLGRMHIAPGLARSVPGGSTVEDPRKWVFAHDASTSTGSSGSPIIWARSKKVVGIHFAGAFLRFNLAHAFSRCEREISQMT